MVVGGRKFPTNTVTFTVNAGELGNLPEGIELTAAGNKENIKVNDTIQYTADLKWNAEENGADKNSAVTWKVYDAKTGTETDKATITEQGLLTAVKPGSVVVTASTANGYAASKLVSIWQEGKMIASDIQWIIRHLPTNTVQVRPWKADWSRISQARDFTRIRLRAMSL